MVCSVSSMELTLYDVFCAVEADVALEYIVDGLEKLRINKTEILTELLQSVALKIVSYSILLLEAHGRKVAVASSSNLISKKLAYNALVTLEFVTECRLPSAEQHLISLLKIYSHVISSSKLDHDDQVNSPFVLNSLNMLINHVYPVNTREGSFLEEQSKLIKGCSNISSVSLDISISVEPLKFDDFQVVDYGLPGCEESLLKIINDFGNHQMDLMKRVNFLEKQQQLFCICELPIVKALAANVESVSKLKDMRVRYGFFTALKFAFHKLTPADRLEFIVHYFATVGPSLTLSESDPGYEKEFEKCLNTVVVSSPENTSTESLSFGERLAWFFMMNARSVMMRVLRFAVNVPKAIYRIIEALQYLKPVCQAEVVTGTDNVQLLIGGLKRMFATSWQKKINDRETDTLIELSTACIKGGIIDPTLFLKVIVPPGIMQNMFVEFAIETLRVFTTILPQLDSTVQWANVPSKSANNAWDNVDTDSTSSENTSSLDMDKVIFPSTFFSAFTQLLVSARKPPLATQYPHYANQLQSLSIDAIIALANNLKSSSFRMNVLAVALQQSIELVYDSWPLNVVVCFHLSGATEGPMHFLVSSCTVNALHLQNDIDVFDAIPCSDDHTADNASKFLCCARGLVQCCCLSFEVVDFLCKKGNLTAFCQSCNTKQVRDLLLCCLKMHLPGQRLDAWHNVQKLIEKMYEKCSPPSEFLLDSLSVDDASGFKLVRRLLPLIDCVLSVLSDQTDISILQQMITCLSTCIKEMLNTVLNSSENAQCKFSAIEAICISIGAIVHTIDGSKLWPLDKEKLVSVVQNLEFCCLDSLKKCSEQNNNNKNSNGSRVQVLKRIVAAFSTETETPLTAKLEEACNAALEEAEMKEENWD